MNSSGYNNFFLVLFLIVTTFGFSNVSAQDAGVIQRELQLQLERTEPLKQLPSTKPTEKKSTNLDESKISIKGFKYKGNSLVSEAQLDEVVKPWTNTQITFSDLKDVTAAIQNLYSKNSRIAQATIPPQDIKDEVILIEIIEAKLGSVIVEPSLSAASLRINLNTAKKYIDAAIHDSQYIDVDPIQRGMLLLNELPGVQAEGDFMPGAKLGESNFRVKLTDTPFFAGQASLSNFGSTSTGIEQATASFSLNNPSGSGDQVTLDAIQSQGSSYAQVGYSLPIGHEGWRAGLQANYLTYHTLKSWSDTRLEGTAYTIGANATYALIRNQGNNANLRFSVEDRNYSNTLLGENFSRYQITSYAAGVSGNYFDTVNSVINYNASISFGNLNINNLTQSDQDETGPRSAGSYQKFSFSLSRTKELVFLPKTTWLISAYGQLASKNLNSAEQIYLGGPFGVRAYPVAQSGGSQGAIISTELQYRLGQYWQLGAFADLGTIQQYVNLYQDWQGLTNANNSYQLSSIGPSLKFANDRWVINAVAAFRIGQNPLYNSSGEQLNADNAYRSVQAWVTAAYTF